MLRLGWTMDQDAVFFLSLFPLLSFLFFCFLLYVSSRFSTGGSRPTRGSFGGLRGGDPGIGQGSSALSKISPVQSLALGHETSRESEEKKREFQR